MAAANLQGLRVDALVPTAVITSCPALQRLTLHDCTPAGHVRTSAAAVAGFTQLTHLSITSSGAGKCFCACQIRALQHLPKLSNLELTWPEVPVQKLQDVGCMSSQLTSLSVGISRMPPWGRMPWLHPGHGQEEMLKSLGRFHALRSLQVRYVPTPPIVCRVEVSGRVFKQWGSKLLHLRSLQLPDAWMRCFDAVDLVHHLPNLHHVQVRCLDAGAANCVCPAIRQACRWQHVQVGYVLPRSQTHLHLQSCVAITVG